jgi:hypothetical protein
VHILESDAAMIELLRPPDAKISGTDRRAIIEGVRLHRLMLLKEWEDAQTIE